MQKDIGRYVDYATPAAAGVTLAAGTSMLSSTAQALTSIVIDRLALPRLYRSCVLAVGAELTAPATFTGAVAVKVQDAAGSSGPFTDYSTATQLLVDSSTEAAYYDGANVQAAFSLDQMVIRAIIEHDLVMRHDFSSSVLTGMTWA